MRWQNLPSSTNIQDMTYGPQLPRAPWDMGPKLPPMAQYPPAAWLMRLMQASGPHTAAQNQWLAQNMPEQLPLNPIAGSQPSGLVFMGNLPVATDKPGQRWPGGPPTYVPDRPIVQGGGGEVDPSIRAHGGWSPPLPDWPVGLTLNSLPNGGQ